MGRTQLNHRQLLIAILIPIVILTAGCSALQPNESSIQDGAHEITVNYQVDTNQTLDVNIVSDEGETLLNKTFNLLSEGEMVTGEGFREAEFTGEPAEINISVGGNTISHEWPSINCNKDEFSSVMIQYQPSADLLRLHGNCLVNDFFSNSTNNTNSSEGR